jgi:branched-chain amino acid transport system substrate-binding protein
MPGTAAIKLARWAIVAAALAAACPAFAGDAVRLGVLTDLSSFGSDVTGKGSVTAVKLAIEDFGGKVND